MTDSDVETRLFSLEQARETLPLLVPVVEDLMDCHQRLKTVMENVHRKPPEDPLEPDEEGQLKAEPEFEEVEELKSELMEYLEEVYSIGAEFQGFERGRVDFPSRLEGRVVYLCWESGEEDIDFWHESYDDCSERQPISDESFSGE